MEYDKTVCESIVVDCDRDLSVRVRRGDTTDQLIRAVDYIIKPIMADMGFETAFVIWPIDPSQCAGQQWVSVEICEHFSIEDIIERVNDNVRDHQNHYAISWIIAHDKGIDISANASVKASNTTLQRSLTSLMD